MKPPEADREPISGNAGEKPPAVSVCPTETLRKRSDFLLAARARRQSAKGLLLQARRRDDDELIRIGYTCSKTGYGSHIRRHCRRSNGWSCRVCW